jgi:hypothetical protein
MPVVFRTYHGHGTFSFQFGLQVTADFKITMRSDAWIEVLTTLPVNSQTSQLINQNQRAQLVKVSLSGQVRLPRNGQVTAPSLLLNILNFTANQQGQTLNLTMISSDVIVIEYGTCQPDMMVELRHGLTNFSFLGCQSSRTALGVTFDKFSVTVEGLSVTYQMLPGYKPGDTLPEDTLLTSEAILSINLNEIDRANELVYDSLMLLSFANSNYIASIYEDLLQQSNLLKTTLKPVKTMSYSGRDYCIDLRNLVDCDLKIFVETAFDQYRKLKQDLGLSFVLEYYTQTKLAPLPELQYLVAVVGIECLLSYVPSYLAKIGKWGKGSGLKDWVVSKITRRPGRRSLRRKMIAILEHFSIPYEKSDLRFIKTRNTIVHTGRFPKSVTGHDASNTLIHFLDRVLLRILGYQDKFYLNRLNHFEREPLP